MCPYPFFEVTPPGAAPGPPVKPGPVFVASGGAINKRIATTRGETAMVDGGMVRAAAHSGSGTGRTGAPAFMTCFNKKEPTGVAVKSWT